MRQEELHGAGWRVCYIYMNAAGWQDEHSHGLLAAPASSLQPGPRHLLQYRHLLSSIPAQSPVMCE
jgi:hypothetical protein